MRNFPNFTLVDFHWLSSQWQSKKRERQFVTGKCACNVKFLFSLHTCYNIISPIGEWHSLSLEEGKEIACVQTPPPQARERGNAIFSGKDGIRLREVSFFPWPPSSFLASTCTRSLNLKKKRNCSQFRMEQRTTFNASTPFVQFTTSSTVNGSKV